MFRGAMSTGPTIDVELIFAMSPPTANRPGRLAASRRRAAGAAAFAAAVAVAVLVVLALL